MQTSYSEASHADALERVDGGRELVCGAGSLRLDCDACDRGYGNRTRSGTAWRRSGIRTGWDWFVGGCRDDLSSTWRVRRLPRELLGLARGRRDCPLGWP